jgi:hypothetical protein
LVTAVCRRYGLNSQNTRRAERDDKTIEEYLKKTELTLNPEKSKILVFGKVRGSKRKVS